MAHLDNDKNWQSSDFGKEKVLVIRCAHLGVRNNKLKIPPPHPVLSALWPPKCLQNQFFAHISPLNLFGNEDCLTRLAHTPLKKCDGDLEHLNQRVGCKTAQVKNFNFEGNVPKVYHRSAQHLFHRFP